MEFRIADTFTDSLARLTGDEQKAVKTTAFDLQTQPGQSGHELPQARQGEGQEFLVGPGQQRHPADRSQDEASLLLCYVGSPRQGLRLGGTAQAGNASHDGAAQLVEIRETVKEIIVPVYVQTELPVVAAPAESRPLFAGCRSPVAGLRRAGRVARRCQDGDHGDTSAADGPSAGRSCGGALGTRDGRQAAAPGVGGDVRARSEETFEASTGTMAERIERPGHESPPDLFAELGGLSLHCDLRQVRRALLSILMPSAVSA